MASMKDFEIRIRNGGDDAVAAMAELWETRENILFDITDAFTRARWIPVTERLPKPGQQVLAVITPRVCSEENPALIETLDYEQEGFYSWKDDEWPKGVTHWMPLPAPPTDGK